MALHGSGFRILECARSRIKDVDLERRENLIRDAARKGDWKYVRWDTREYLANLAEDETENANFRLRNAAIFEQLKRAYEDRDNQMLPIPPEVRRGPWENEMHRARDLEPVQR